MRKWALWTMATVMSVGCGDSTTHLTPSTDTEDTYAGDADESTPSDSAPSDSESPSDSSSPDSAAPPDTSPEDGDGDDTSPDGGLSDSTSPEGDTSEETDSTDPDTHQPDPEAYKALLEKGPYAVGYRLTTTSWQPPNLFVPRHLDVAVWYPAQAAEGSSPRYANLHTDSEAFENAPLKEGLSALPTVLFSHGNYGYAEQSSFLARHLASHGYLVLAPYHTHNTVSDRTGGYELLYYRPKDLSTLLDTLQAAREGAAGLDPVWYAIAPFSGGPVAAVGHSYGGYTVLAAGGGKWDVGRMRLACANGLLAQAVCEAVETYGDYLDSTIHDPRIEALVPLSPGSQVYFGSAGIEAIERPTFLMTGSLDRTTPNLSDGNPVWEGLKGKAHNRRLNFQTAGHYSFSDICSLGAFLSQVGANDGCGLGFLSPERTYRAINAYTLAFLRLHLESNPVGQGLLSGELAIESDATLTLGASAP